MPKSWMLVRGLALALAGAGAAACSTEPAKVNSTVLGIQAADGTLAFGLVPMRQHHATGGMSLTDSQAAAIENAMRLALGIVRCEGDGAAAALNRLETLSQDSFRGVRRLRGALVDADG